MGQTTKRGVPARALLVLARGLLSGSAALFLFYLLVVATRRWRDDAAWAHFPPDFGCDDAALLDACTLERVAYLHWLPTVAALAGCCLAASAAAASLPYAARLAAQRQLPLGRAFWARWCGGLSAGDAFLAAGVLLINAAWAASLGSRYRKLLKFFAGGSGNGGGGGAGAGGGNGATPVWALEVMLASIALGQLLMPNLALLFFPVARGSPLLQAAGVSYPSAVRAHRWLGHLTMAVASAHSLGFWGVWLARGQWAAEALAQGARVNNLAGGLSFLGGLALWLTSMEWARRARYGLFIATHHAGWWVFFLAGVAHYAPLAWFFLPGLLLYFVDAAFRLSSWATGNAGGGNVRALEVAWEEEDDKQGGEGGAAAAATTAAAAATATGAAVVAIVLRPPSGFAAADAGIVWTRAPAVSFWQWHPFEYVLVQGEGAGAGGGGDQGGGGGGGDSDDSASPSAPPLLVALHIKAYGRWSRAFALLAREAAQSGRVDGLDVRLEAPYGDEPPAGGEEHGAGASDAAGLAADEEGGGAAPPASSPIVVLAGGIGATAALSLLRELEREQEEHGAPRRRPLLLVWAARHAPELSVLLPRLLDAAARAGVDLETRLYFTGRGGLAALTSGWASASATAAPASSASCLLSLRPPPLKAASSQCPVLAPGRLLAQLAQRLSAHASGCLGALAAMLVVRQLAVVSPARMGLDGWTTAQAGLASAAAIALGAALPALAVVAAARALLSGGARGPPSGGGGGDGASGPSSLRCPLLAPSADEGRQAAPASLPPRVRFVAGGGGAVAVVAASADNGDGKGAALELPVALGRPVYLRGLVCDWLAAHKAAGPAAPAELYAMGPEALVAEARMMCDDFAAAGATTGGGEGGGEGAGSGADADAPGSLPAVLFRLRTHEL